MHDVFVKAFGYDEANSTVHDFLMTIVRALNATGGRYDIRQAMAFCNKHRPRVHVHIGRIIDRRSPGNPEVPTHGPEAALAMRTIGPNIKLALRQQLIYSGEMTFRFHRAADDERYFGPDFVR